MRLYVGNLPYTVDEAALRETFQKHGVVTSVVVARDLATEQSKGFGFVEMEEEAARKAMSALNRSTLQGRTIWVNEAKAKS